MAWNISAPYRATAEEDPQRSILNKPLGELRFDQAPFEKVITSLADKSGVPIEPNWQSLEKIGVERDSAVTLHMFDASLNSALKAVMDELTLEFPEGGVPEFLLDAGKIKIASSADLERVVVRAYDVSDLVRVSVAEAARERAADDRQMMGNGFGGEPQDRSLALRSMITRELDSVAWDNGAGSPSLNFIGERMIVIQSLRNQRAIATMLDRVREVEAARTRGKPVTRGVDAISP
jgi:hypothetical protein